MIFRESEAAGTAASDARGGCGHMTGRSYVSEGSRPAGSRLSMAAVNTLEPGASIGVHAHDADEEVYLVLSGSGEYTDSDGRAYPVGAGDFTLTRQGESHGLRNTGAEPLTFAAVIVTDRP
ncbi:MAG: cupin domain-containing protein [Deltaproteobacteria bacterium]|jgi:mannose-6-phosphate isomerase-like protein (cupin superfamily)|nr:cupin domain-containing protein [Deltaproteobacteria bacterium]